MISSIAVFECIEQLDFVHEIHQSSLLGNTEVHLSPPVFLFLQYLHIIIKNASLKYDSNFLTLSKWIFRHIHIDVYPGSVTETFFTFKLIRT